MLPFGLKIVWFVISLTGMLASLVVSWAFVRVVDAGWIMLYNVGNVMLQGIFCLGMIYRMDPFLMPRAFCIAQSIIISISAFFLAGVAFSFSMATSMTVLKPKTWGDGERAMKWKNAYYAPIVAFPVLGSIVYIVCLFKYDAVQPSDDMHCDTTSPEWVRLLSYAGVALVMSLPSLYLSISSILRVYKTNQHLQRARTDTFNEFTSLPRRSRSTRIAKAVNMSARKPKRQSARISTGTTQQFHLPFRASGGGISVDEKADSFIISTPYRGHEMGGSASQISVAFPTFATPTGVTAAGTIVVEPRLERRDTADTEDLQVEFKSLDVGDSGIFGSGGGGDVQDRKTPKPDDWDDEDPLHVHAVDGRVSDSVDDSDCWNENDDKINRDSPMTDVAKDEFMMTEIEACGYVSRRPSDVQPRRKTKKELPNLSPAIWRIILFQVGFITVQFLTCISTIVDLAIKRSTPTPLGTHHFALLLAAWGPVLVFGHLPSVRRNLIFWRPIL
ncbi:hypothetical protein D9613_008580 [Agrocybe pediades]|uniref:Uncharacterized protein n=1 Tax=Agrocybe pediades TaxID=84607 RepID=A0A8H4VN81_9AGAR|nr:hypothetical protein D9613_008580 [Agrocybe pediades]KAF9561438.1 hypothetical protein CPC08DRAFT_433186 [Agrocybe pediades]